jgi:hypothetical protein
MTEQEWLKCARPGELLAFAHPRISDRKLRLFACACCRQVWNQFVPPVVVGAVAVAEAFADGEIRADALARVREIVGESARGVGRPGSPSETSYFLDVLGACLSASCQSVNAAELAQDASHVAARAAGDGPLREGLRVIRAQDRPPEFFEELAAQSELARDIFGNPFREVAFDPAWRTSDVLALASAMYAKRDFGAMPILADALQEAGCDDDANPLPPRGGNLLTHCREPCEHVRGCWVVDLVLGKE